MKLSNILRQANDDFDIACIIEDREFETLGLAGADINLKYCTFIEDEKYIKAISENACMAITKPEIADKLKDIGLCISENPRISFFKLHNYLSELSDYRLTEDFDTKIGDNCNISPLSYIAPKNIKIGSNVTIEEFVSIKENTIIGDNTIIRAGSIIGGEGYEFKRIQDGDILPVTHIGWTDIGNNVEIQQNTCIDKAIYPWDKTLIGNNCKIDNLVHIAHGVKLGEGVFLVAGSLLGGRTVIKENTWVGVGATISNGLTIGKESSINIGAVVTKSLEDDSNVTGNFAIDHKKFIEFIKSIR